MIDWPTTANVLACLEPTAAAALAEQVATTLREAPVFRNTDYPFTPVPMFVESRALSALIERTQTYVALLEKVIRLYREHGDVRRFFGLDPAAEGLVATRSGLAREIAICRLDGYLTAGESQLCVLENNSDCPAGTLFTQRLNAATDHVISATLSSLGLMSRAMPADVPGAMLEALLSSYRAWGGGASSPRLAILQLAGRSNVESHEMAAEFTRLGVAAVVLDPREATFTLGGVHHEGERIDLVWNKINTASFRDLLAEYPDAVEQWRRCIDTGAICHLNGFGARYVTESKLCTAFVQEEAFAPLFDDAERELVATLLPWARKVEADRSVDWRGDRVDFVSLLLARQMDFVLKQPYDIRGDGVTVGRGVDRDTWCAAVASAVRDGHVAQAYVRPTTVPIVTDLTPRITPMPASLDTFLFEGRFQLLGSKASFHDKLNLFQGGRKIAVRVAAPIPAADGS